ncbi:hypothetical protein [Pinibacter aurantiacus]|uniref:Uncharacterized protein n=1 Tax=Pinibacter aurantiacus TaxID=2851599 RepID=A0A9E2W7W2_9BACT|nr:hypothetical protein [Pinibacter aurantiacus]MBV4357002.1 hypothetical protein [Pinibacter aurantiacus]
MKFIFILCLLFFCGIVTAQKKTVPVNKVYTKVDVEAEFKGGASVWARFLNKNLQVPKKCVDNDELDNFPSAITFIVRRNGSVDSIKTNREDGSCWNSEIVRFIKLTDGMWNPALIHGKAVDSYYKLANMCVKFETE